MAKIVIDGSVMISAAFGGKPLEAVASVGPGSGISKYVLRSDIVFERTLTWQGSRGSILQELFITSSPGGIRAKRFSNPLKIANSICGS